MATVQSEARPQRSLGEITRLLDKHRVLDALTHRQEGPRRDLLEHMQHRQNVAELQRHLRAMHAADIAYVLESPPLEDRRTVWEQVHVEMAAERAGDQLNGTVILNLIVAALAGVAVPVSLHASGRDPAHGSSVLLTFITDAMGFFFFLGLATVFLV